MEQEHPRKVIAELEQQGLTPYRIARRLNATGVPTATGLVGTWNYSMVKQYADPAAHTAYQRAWRARQGSPSS